MLNISDVAGRYTESGRWWDSDGNTGELQGSVEVSAKDDQLAFKLDGIHVIRTGRVEAYAPTSLEGTGGGVVTSGTLFVGDRTIILEYEADVRGRKERNTDIWDFSGIGLRRSGLIRQDKRTIWFEASMQRAA
jgi:hypothetical protein